MTKPSHDPSPAMSDWQVRAMGLGTLLGSLVGSYYVFVAPIVQDGEKIKFRLGLIFLTIVIATGSLLFLIKGRSFRHMVRLNKPFYDADENRPPLITVYLVVILSAAIVGEVVTWLILGSFGLLK
ncbi:hypothetical protein GC197_15300 [bacterium]|nr:hypothetical protein [bacterium]